MKYLIPAVRIKIFMTILLGLAYPFLMTGISQVVFPRQANGDLLKRGDQIIGSKLIGQNFERVEYFWSRPSAISYNPLPSGGSNLGQTSQTLKDLVNERRLKIKSSHSDQIIEVPQDLLFASASGLDPHISPEAAHYQILRVAKARHMSEEQILNLIEQATEKRSLGFLGEPFVNVLVLNLALDKSQDIEAAPQLAPVIQK